MVELREHDSVCRPHWADRRTVGLVHHIVQLNQPVLALQQCGIAGDEFNCLNAAVLKQTVVKEALMFCRGPTRMMSSRRASVAPSLRCHSCACRTTREDVRYTSHAILTASRQFSFSYPG